MSRDRPVPGSLPVVPRGVPFLPTSAEEMHALGWDAVDVVFVTGDAYVDHPSFAMAVLGRVLEARGFRVAILPQPDWRSADAWRALGRPRLFYAVSAGNMDSMINHYTASRKRRNDDAYSPGGRIGLRPDRPTPVYAQRCREAFPGVPVVIGGIEASLRRIAHFDYWSETVRPSMLVPSKADLLAFGKGEETIVAIAERLRAGESVRGPARPARRRVPARDEGGAPRAAGVLSRLEDARAPGLRRGRRRQARLREDDAHLPPGDEPVQRAPPRPGARRPEGRPQPARACRSTRRGWTRSTTCRTRAVRTPATTSRSRRSR